MSTNAIERLDVDARVRKRAEWEAFDFTILEDGSVEVRNESYPDEEVAEHTYTVELEDGEPVACDCPYAEHHDGDCKHAAAVGLRRRLIGAVHFEEERSDAPAEDGCPHGEPHCDGPESEGLPCYRCFKEGR